MTSDDEFRFGLHVVQVGGALIIGWISAAALKARKKALKNRLDVLFSGSETIETKQLFTKENERIGRVGIIRKLERCLEFTFIEDGLQKDHQTFGKLEELENYLQEKTCFRLGDFARLITITGS